MGSSSSHYDDETDTDTANIFMTPRLVKLLENNGREEEDYPIDTMATDDSIMTPGGFASTTSSTPSMGRSATLLKDESPPNGTEGLAKIRSIAESHSQSALEIQSIADEILENNGRGEISDTFSQCEKEKQDVTRCYRTKLEPLDCSEIVKNYVRCTKDAVMRRLAE